MPNKKNPIQMLEDDHEKVEGLLEKLTSTTERGEKTREKLIHEIQRELEIHTAIEEEIFYPAVRAATDEREHEEMHFEFIEEHHLAGEVELLRALEVEVGTVEFAARCEVLKELVTHHIQEERERMFPLAKKLFDQARMNDLASQMADRKRELMNQVSKAA